MNKYTPIWMLDHNGSEKAKYPKLEENLTCDTVIVGGGLVGLITGYFLTKKGQKVIILEANRVMQGVSGHSTAKITSQHDIIYSKLIKRFGFNTAKIYAEANQTAIDKYEEIINTENIECEFIRQDANLYTRNPNKVKKLIEETKAALKVGIDAHFSKESSLPFPVEGVMTFRNQAMFNPYDFGMTLAEKIIEAGGRIFEHSRVLNVTPISVETVSNIVRAKSIVIATNFPIVNFPGWYFARLYQSRTYLVSFENAPKIDGYYLSVDKDAKTFRMYKDYLLVGGQNHKTGKKGNVLHYNHIKNFAKGIYPNMTDKTQWSAQDGFTLDGLPYIGHYSKNSKNVYVATGFSKWGITNSMVSGIILSDLITKGTHEWASVFSPSRPIVPRAIAQLVYNVIRFAFNFVAGWICAPFRKTPTCTHMYCKLSYNKSDGTYDCACHGSRFSKNGVVINPPSKKILKK